MRIWWGQGKQDGSFYPMLDHAGDTHWTISVWTYARVYVQFDRLATPSRQRNGAPSMNEAARHELLDSTGTTFQAFDSRRTRLIVNHRSYSAKSPSLMCFSNFSG